ncbi:hypothetical protein GGI12_001563 [Dipsacomyces acuminosporus]|nr:hypothetical protein GGI12_001563 [Dipsacomyces acuminosporus]
MPPKRPRSLRSSRKSLADWDESFAEEKTESRDKSPLQQDQKADSTGSETAKVDLEDLVEFQRSRRQKQRGIGVEQLAKGERRKTSKRPFTPASRPGGTGQGAEDDGDNDAEASGTKPERRSATRSLDGAFTAQTNKLDVNKHMMAYIENEMSRRSGGGGIADGAEKEAEDNAAARQHPSIDELYQVPDHLQVVDAKPVSEGNVAMAAKMLTSIPEVDLGAESRIQNIRATNKVVARMAEGLEGAGTQQNAHFHEPSPASARYKRFNDPSDRASKATDDIVLQRFKKRMRR